MLTGYSRNLIAKDDVNDYDIRQAVQSLPFPERELCVWWMHGYSYKELAEAYDIPMGTLKSRVFHVKKFVAGKIKPLTYDE